MEKPARAHVEGRPLYHICLDLSIGKMHKKSAPFSTGRIRQIAQQRGIV